MAKILVVEDDKDLNNAYKIILKHEGHEVVGVFDGKEALDKIKDFSPDLILLDLLMPVMGGLEFLQNWQKTGSCSGCARWPGRWCSKKSRSERPDAATRRAVQSSPAWR